MKRLMFLLCALLLTGMILCGCAAVAKKFPSSEEVKAIVPQKIDTGEEALLFDAFPEGYDVEGAERSCFHYLAHYNSTGELVKIEFWSSYEICCHDDDSYEAVYDNQYNLIEYHYENGKSPFVHFKRNLHHYF